MSVPFFVVLPDSTKSKIAIVQSNGSFRLPQFQTEESARFNTVSKINSAVSAAWQVPVTVARCITPDENNLPAVFSLHNHAPSWQLPAEAQWVEVSRLKDLAFELPLQRQAVLSWLASEQDAAWKTVPWSSPAWFARAADWIRQSVTDLGAVVLNIEQQRTWAISCILKVSTSTGVLYFKAVPDFFGHEPVLAMYMQQNFAQYMVEIAAIEPEQHWTLTREWAGSPPANKDEWANILRALKEIQEQCNESLDDLLLFGCKDRRISQLPALLQPIYDDVKSEQMRALFGINETEAQELGRRLTLLPALCQKLASFGIPETLVHGDLWSSNVIVEDRISGKAPIIFDWTDAALSHPFFDIYCVITSERDAQMRLEQQRAHLEVWSESYPAATVNAAFDASQMVAPFYYLLAYRHVALNAPAEARWELLFLLQRFVRKILELPL